MLSKNKAYEIIDKVLSYSNYYTMVTVNYKEEGLTRFANSQIHQNVFNSDTNVEIVIYHNKRESKVSTNIIDDEGLRQAVKDAEENLTFLPEGDIDIPEISLPSEISYDIHDESLSEKFDISSRAKLIGEGIKLLEEDYLTAGALTLNKTTIAIGNTKGIKRYCINNSVGFNTVVMHKEGASGYAELVTNKASELDVVEEFKKAIIKAKMGLNPISIEPGTYDVILEPLAVGDLLLFTADMGFAAKAQQNESSCFLGKLGQKVFGDNITIRDEVKNENTFMLPFDFEGYERQNLNIVENGVLKELAYDVRSAIEDNTKTTGHSVGYSPMGGFPINLVMEGGKDTLESLIKSTKRGLLVSRFNYMNEVNPRQGVLTALTRDGLFLIEDGKIKCAARNMRMTESVLNAFNNVVGITAERVKVPGWFGVCYVPALKVENFHFTGKTER
jgi:PmbA protein